MEPWIRPLFFPITGSSTAGNHPAFNSSALGSTSVDYGLEATGVREWDIHINRTVRLVSQSCTQSYYVQFGATQATASTNSIFIAGAYPPHIFYIPGNVGRVAFVSNETAIVNVGLGYGGRTGPDLFSLAERATSTGSTAFMFTTQQAASVLYVPWLSSSASFDKGDAEHILLLYHDTTST